MDDRQNHSSISDLIRTAQTARFGFSLIGGSGAGVIIIVAVAVFLIVLSTPILSGQQAETVPGQISIPSSNLDIGTYFKITGDSGSQKNLIYKFFQETDSFPKYQKLLTEVGPVDISFDFDPGLDTGLCGGGVVGSSITFYNFPRSACGESGKKYLFYHESGHVVGNRNKGVYDSFSLIYPTLKEQDNQVGIKCYTDDGFLLSYQKEFGGVAGAVNESFAEGVALSILKNWKTFDNFPTNCPATYNWIKTNVLGL